MKGAGPAAYRDVIQMMDLAIRTNGAEFLMPTHSAAIKAAQRCHQWRMQDRKIQFENVKRDKPDPNSYRTTEAYNNRLAEYRMNTEFYEGLRSAYDRLIIRRPIDNVLRIEVKPDLPFLEARTLDGRPIDVAPIEPSYEAPAAATQETREPGYFNPHEPLGLEIDNSGT